MHESGTGQIKIWYQYNEYTVHLVHSPNRASQARQEARVGQALAPPSEFFCLLDAAWALPHQLAPPPQPHKKETSTPQVCARSLPSSLVGIPESLAILLRMCNPSIKQTIDISTKSSF